jgi:hypothetical protein
MTRTVPALALLALAGCSTGALGSLPSVPDPARASQIVIVRPAHVVGIANSYKLAVDGAEIYAIRSGQYVQFEVPAGERTFTVKCFGGWAPIWNADDHRMTVEPRQTYYLLVRPSARCAEIVPGVRHGAPELLDGLTRIE